jgi:hypothetical protein
MLRLALALLILCHLFVGVILGLTSYLWLRDERVLFAIMIGSVLPDIIDKPLGHIILNGSLDNGRILFHGLLVIGLLVVGAVVARRSGLFLIMVGLAVGMLSHQLLDAMWLDPVAWFFPALGPYTPEHYPDFFSVGFLAGITSPTEWIFFLVSASLLFPLTLWRWRSVPVRWKRPLSVASQLILRAGPWLLALAGLTILTTGAFSPSENVEELTSVVILGITCLLGTMFLIAWNQEQGLTWDQCQ